MRNFDLTTPGGRAAYLLDRHYDDLVRRAPGPCPSDLTRGTAEDAVQDVLFAIARARGDAPQRPEELLAYAIVAVRRANARLARERLRAPITPIRAGAEPAAASDPARELAERSEALDRLRDVLETVTAGHPRRIAALHLLSYGRDEIAARVGVSPRQVRRVVESVQLTLHEQERRAGGS